MNRRIAGVALAAAMLFAGPALAGKYFEDDGLAIGGYDPVAYFTDGKPVEGEERFSLDHDGTTWRFASAANRDTFKADPAKYAPQYGGFCAYAVSQGYTAKIEPDAWRIVDGKLYLNYSTSVNRRWAEDIKGYIEAGDRNWPEIVKKLEN